MESRDTFRYILYEHTRTNKYMNTHIPTKPIRPKPSYKQAPKANINKFEKENSASHKEHKSNENIKEKLRLLSLAKIRDQLVKKQLKIRFII